MINEPWDFHISVSEVISKTANTFIIVGSAVTEDTSINIDFIDNPFVHLIVTDSFFNDDDAVWYLQSLGEEEAVFCKVAE